MSGATLYLARHGEKPKGKVKGYLTPQGSIVDRHSLTLQGWARAAGFIKLFNPVGGTLRAGLARPTHIYAADGPSAGLRMKETASLLASSLGLQTILRFDEGEERALAKELLNLPASAVALVVWEHSALPKIVNALGSAKPKPPKTFADRYDILWRFVPDGQGGWIFTQIPELLLPTDSPKTMKTSFLGRLFS